MRFATVPLLFTLALFSTAVSADEHEPDYRTTQGISEDVYGESVDEEYRVRTPHGVIYGVVRRPVVPDGITVPVILTYTPYNILARPVAAMTHLDDPVAEYFVPRGYARASFDLVGTRESSGCYDHGGVRERETGAAVVEFLGTRPWSNGKVGMIGGSYDGTTQWAAAVETPPHLTTIVPQVAIGRWYDYAYGQGVRFASGSGTPLLFDYGFGFLPPTGVTGGTDWAEALRDHATPCERVEHNDRAFLPDPVYDAYWDERDYLARIGKVTASVLLEGSWRDYNVHPVNSFEMWRALPDGHPKKLWMGQAGHSDNQLEDSEDIYHAWFDYWLLGLPTKVMDLPRSDSQVNTDDRFQDASWPPPGTASVPLTLGRSGDVRGTLGLLGDLEQARWTDNDPVLSEGDALDGSAGDSAVLFAGPAVTRPVRISGVPELDVRVTTSGVSTFLTPVLFDEDDGGVRRVVTRGLLNSRNRDGDRTSTPLTAGATWRARLAFQPVDWLLEEDHRLGLALMSMNTSEALYPDDVQSTNTVVLDRSAVLRVPVSLNSAALGDAVRSRVAPPAPKPPVVPPPAAAPPAPRRPLPATGTDLAYAPLLLLLAAAAAGARRLHRGT